MTASRHAYPDSHEGAAHGGAGNVARYALRRGIPALGGVALLVAGIVRPSRPLYVAGVLGCAIVLGAFVASRLTRPGRGRLWRWAGGVLAATVVVAAGIGLPWWALQRAYDGDSVWTVDYHATWATHHGDRVYLADGGSGLAVDRRTGRVLGRAPRGGDPEVLADSGIGFNFGSHTAAYDGSLRLLWELEGREGWRSFVAATNRTTVVQSCVPGNTSCSLQGIDTGGRVRWTRRSVHSRPLRAHSHSPSNSGYIEGDVLPGVVVWQGDPDHWTMADADDGGLLGRVSVAGHRYVGAVGDTVVVSDRPGGYRFRGIRRGRLAWTVSLPAGAPSSDGDWGAAPILLFPTRLYASLEEGRGVTVDLKTGDHRVMDFDPLAGNVAASDEVLLVREQRRVRGFDPSSGRVLWEMDAPGHGIPGMDAGSGAVVLLARPSGNPLLPEEVRENGTLVTVLDARTGRRTGRLIAPRSVWESLPVGPGQVLVVKGRATRLIGETPDAPWRGCLSGLNGGAVWTATGPGSRVVFRLDARSSPRGTSNDWAEGGAGDE